MVRDLRFFFNTFLSLSTFTFYPILPPILSASQTVLHMPPVAVLFVELGHSIWKSGVELMVISCGNGSVGRRFCWMSCYQSPTQPMDNQSGPLSMFGSDQRTKIMLRHRERSRHFFVVANTQRFGSSLDIGHMFSYPFFSLHISTGGTLSSCCGFWEFAITTCIQPQCSDG